MRLKNLHPFLFILISLSGFAQEKKQTVYLQVLAGNSFYFKPMTATDPLSAGVEMNFIAGQIRDSAWFNCFYSFGIGWNESQQSFDVVWAKPKGPTPSVNDLFNTNEFTFNAGGVINYKLTPGVSLCVPYGFQGAHNYTWINDPGDTVSIVSLKQISYGVQWDYLARPFYPPPGVNRVNVKQQYFSFESLQFYFYAGLQLKFQLTKRASFLIGVKSRAAFYYESVGQESVTLEKMNYAPIKLMPHFALQCKIFK
ncbi:MAG: hypothetical protein ACXVPN_02870 [Bacteroidia bacterium]